MHKFDDKRAVLCGICSHCAAVCVGSALQRGKSRCVASRTTFTMSNSAAIISRSPKRVFAEIE